MVHFDRLLFLKIDSTWNGSTSHSSNVLIAVGYFIQLSFFLYFVYNSFRLHRKNQIQCTLLMHIIQCFWFIAKSIFCIFSFSRWNFIFFDCNENSFSLFSSMHFPCACVCTKLQLDVQVESNTFTLNQLLVNKTDNFDSIRFIVRGFFSFFFHFTNWRHFQH